MEKLLLFVNGTTEEVALILARDIASQYRRIKEESEKEYFPVPTRRIRNKREIEENLLRESIYYKVLEVFSDRKKLRKYRVKDDKKRGATKIKINNSSDFLGEFSSYVIGQYEFYLKNNMLIKIIEP